MQGGDLYDAAAAVELVGEDEIAAGLRGRADSNGRPDSVGEILGRAREAARLGDETETDRCLYHAAAQAQQEWTDDFRAEAFAQVARVAHELDRPVARERALERCLATLGR